MSQLLAKRCYQFGVGLAVLGGIGFLLLLLSESATNSSARNKAESEARFQEFNSYRRMQGKIEYAPPAGEPFSPEAERVYLAMLDRMKMPTIGLVVFGLGLIVLSFASTARPKEIAEQSDPQPSSVQNSSRKAILLTVLIGLGFGIYFAKQMFADVSTDQRRQAFHSLIVVISVATAVICALKYTSRDN